ncbi:hypothetical protein PENTCL1PPCAC_13316 [Pristionchus entomophagus]|uniref:Protein-serine/threonine kinase n=1 Tax=Pristionchus entomophagus TaxID=358040 RepID=A0AAV5T6K2_9BILA|nr:hypothetical protein PENTCL1PPCAC_13316 [Pristionchus entomophagus]
MFATRRALGPFVGTVAKKLDHYSQFQPSSLSIQQYLDFGRNGTAVSSFEFLRKELLVRLANIMQEISLLPPKLLATPSSKMVAGWYCESFEDLIRFEDAKSTQDKVDNFNDQLQAILKRHAHVVETMAEGLIELRESDGVDIASERGIQYFLDRFYINRISIRMLQNQHLVVFGNVLPESPRHVGCIDPACDVESVVLDAFENAKFLCDRYYLTSPMMKMEMHNMVNKGQPINLVAVPSHLYHIMFELFKNAMRATLEFHGVDDDPPDIKVYVVKGSEDLSIKISDRGGGVSRTVLERLFNYMYSTAPPPPRDGTQAPLVSFVFNLHFIYLKILLLLYLMLLSPPSPRALPFRQTKSRFGRVGMSLRLESLGFPHNLSRPRTTDHYFRLFWSGGSLPSNQSNIEEHWIEFSPWWEEEIRME